MRLATVLIAAAALLAGCNSRPLGDGVARSATGATTSDGFPATCSTCHGDATSPAPPADLLGQSDPSLRGVGAHRSHLFASHNLSRRIDCATCHLVPEGSSVSDHVVAPWPVQLSFSGLAVKGGAQPSASSAPRTGEVRADAALKVTCSSVYCHGATLAGGAQTSPVWNMPDPKWTACTACHGFPPATKAGGAPHSASTHCAVCHGQTVAADGSIAHPENHVDGVVEVTGHPPGWMDPASGDFHASAADKGIIACTGCHGADLGGGDTGIACASCHRAGGAATDFSTCVACHGGTDNATGAPPRATWGNRSPVAVGAHSSHVSARHGLSRALDCSACHVKPDGILSAGHVDGAVAVTRYRGGDANLAAAAGDPGWSEGAATCATAYCHGATLAGGTNKAPTWTRVDGSQAACGTCHGVPPPAASGHPQRRGCGDCHTGYTETSVNPATHVNGLVDVGAMTCTSCHGDQARAPTGLNPQLAAAPPSDTAGNTDTASPGVGAHQAHLSDGPLRGAIACSECHAVPASTQGHPSGTLSLAWGPLATAGGATPSFDGATCASTWCHGATLNAGGTNQTPSWTGGPSQAACGTCHGAPPPAPHPAVPGGLSTCSACHTDTVDGAGAIIPTSAGGKHLDGILQVTGHSAAWVDPANPGFHAYAANRGIAACQGCHGADLSGGSTGVACASCHTAGGKANDFKSCAACHGGTDNPTGAPPRATWGNADPVAVGAHTSHVSAAHGLTGPLDCVACHKKPTSALTPGHVDGAVAVTGYTGADPALSAAITDPTWDAARVTCTTSYCHGATLLGGKNQTTDPIIGDIGPPKWTQVDGKQATCGACHGLPPDTGDPVNLPNAHWFHVNTMGQDCSSCHPGYSALPGLPFAVNTGLHLNGRVDVAAAADGTVIQGWDCATCHFAFGF